MTEWCYIKVVLSVTTSACVCLALLYVGGRPLAETEYAGVHVLVLHPAGPPQDAQRRQPAAGQSPKNPRPPKVTSPQSKCRFTHRGVCVCVCVDRLVPQSLLGTHNLGRVHYEPVKDRHGNVLLVTIREVESQHSLLSGKWMLVTKLQSQRKSLSTPEEPYALDILIITLQVRRLR